MAINLGPTTCRLSAPAIRAASARRSTRAVLFTAATLAALALSPAVVGAASVELELATEQSFPLGGAQQWLDLFARMGQTSIRIRQALPEDRANVQNLGTEAQPHYRVTGILTGRNRLRLPGAEFGLADRLRIEEWIARLRDEGAAALEQKHAAFGLTDAQLVAFHDQLAVPVTFATRGRRVGDVARDIVHLASVDFTVSPTAREAFQGDETLGDELRSLTCGTALAAAVRPLGLVLRPEKIKGPKVRLLICGVREVEEAWPIGWPLQDIPANVAPKLFESLKVTIVNRPLTEAVDAIQPRVDVPILFDYNSLARQRVDPAASKVSYTRDRSSYFRILENLCQQLRLSCELRADEAGKPFLWISAR